MFKEMLSVIIPTKDRCDDLHRLLGDISSQAVLPLQVIVADGGDASCETLLNDFPQLNIDYLRCKPASLTAQRNAGLKKVRSEATLVAFLDDDVSLEKESFSNMIRFWENASGDIGGAGFNLTNIPFERRTILDRLFLVNPEKPGAILRSGFQNKSRVLNETVNVKWLVGCATVWRKHIFDEFTFDEWFSGYAHCEDVDFSYRVGRKYKMFIVADARAEHISRHLYRSEDIATNFSLGKMHVTNRLYLVRKNPGFSLLLAYWSCFGLFLNNLIRGVFKGDERCMLRAKGNMAGFLSSFSIKSRKEYLK